MVLIMSKDLKMCVLLDFYGEMLTEKQRDVLNLYYNEDLSLAEIATDLSISRQGVLDNIKRSEKILLNIENKLGMVSRFEGLNSNIDKLQNELLTLPKKDTLINITNIIDDIKKLL